jgi:hypothetical protein
MRLWLALLFVCAGAHAQPDEHPTAWLEWIADPACMGQDELERAVSEQLERPAFIDDHNAEMVVRGHASARPEGGFRVELTLHARNGEAIGDRTLETATECRELDDSLAVVLATLLDVRREDLPPERAQWSFMGRGGAGILVGLLPLTALELIAGVSMIHIESGLGIELDLAFDWTDSAPVAEGRVIANAAGARLFFSAVLTRGPNAELAARIGAGAGPIWAGASGFSTVNLNAGILLEARTGFRASVRMGGPLWLELVADFGIVPIRPTFVAVNADGSRSALFEPTFTIGAFWVGFSLRSG